MRIGCVIASLGSGGAERVMLSLCTAWAARGDTVTLFTFDDGSQDFHAVPVGVTRVALDIAGVSSSSLGAIRANVARLRTLRRALRSVALDVIVSFTDRTNVSTLLAARGLGIPVVISERIDPRRHDIGTAWSMLRRRTYRGATALVVQTERVRSWAETHVSASRVHVIGNPLREVAAPPVAAGDRAATIAAVGRLVPQKGFDTLLRAFALVHRTHPAWRLVISGEGPLRASLEAQVRELGLDAVVTLPGRTSTVDAVLAGSAVFVLSSRYEGFPNVLLEAMACGCACVATDCDSGPSDLLEHDALGLLVPVDDAAALADAITRVLDNPVFRSQLGESARASTQRFAPARMLQAWDDVFVASRRRAA
ncbi:glycosyltransferase family 4 protein [Gemmatimonas sp.]|uniref:glycosyltransferase family 4 protein n=1 Tax=Gemmatimonas sp. TaxID=1962908 RepID=UPI00286E82DA|nr:glycosyltransferase family 4 protein [Gemmatimonas sp.]